jgi:hypothetical protein
MTTARKPHAAAPANPARTLTLPPPTRRSEWALLLPYVASWPVLASLVLVFLVATNCGGW